MYYCYLQPPGLLRYIFPFLLTSSGFIEHWALRWIVNLATCFLHYIFKLNIYFRGFHSILSDYVCNPSSPRNSFLKDRVIAE